jgi:predicted aspartyl protease
MIDTGFTGFLMMPLKSAHPLTLTLIGQGSCQLADGSISPTLMTRGSIAINGQITTGVIALQHGDGKFLLGIDYLNKSRRALWLDGREAALVDDAFVDEVNQTLNSFQDRSA